MSAPGKEGGTPLVPVTVEEVKSAIARYSGQQDRVLSGLYGRFDALRQQHWPDASLPDAVIAVTTALNSRKLARYTACDGYKVPHAIEFNETFIALNWEDREVVEADRTLVDHLLLHEMIHLYQDAILHETFRDSWGKHGRSFRREAQRLGLQGKGRIMACPYPLKNRTDNSGGL